MKASRAAPWLVAIAVALATAPHAAAAESSDAAAAEQPDAAAVEAPDAAAQARALFREASTLAERGEWERALDLYQTAFATYPHANTLYNIGYSELQLARLERALLAMNQALDDGAFEPARRLSAERRRAAEETKQDIVRRLAVPAPEPAKAEVLADSGEPATMTREPSRALVLVPRVNVPRDRSPPPPAPLREDTSDRDGLRTAAYASLTVGGAGLLLAGASVVVMLATDRKLESACTARRCPDSEASAVSRYRLAAGLTNVGLLAGGAGAAVGTGLLIYSF